MSHLFGNQNFQLRLSDRNGAIESIRFPCRLTEVVQPCRVL